MDAIKIGRGELPLAFFERDLAGFLSLPIGFKKALLPSNTEEEIDAILTELWEALNAAKKGVVEFQNTIDNLLVKEDAGRTEVSTKVQKPTKRVRKPR
jgi:hypothetical protein